MNQLNRIKLMISVAKENYRANREGGFRLENPADPTRGGEDFGPIHLSEGQLAQIEEAKQKAGVNK